MFRLSSFQYLAAVELFANTMYQLNKANNCSLTKNSIDFYIKVLKSLYKTVPSKSSLENAITNGLKRWHATLLENRKQNLPSPNIDIYFSEVYELISQIPPNRYTSSYSSVIKKFVIFLGSFVDGSLKLNLMIKDHILLQMIASAAIFASPTVVQMVVDGKLGNRENLKKGNVYASWTRCSFQRKKKNQEIGGILGKNVYGVDIKCDSNNQANQAIRKAILASYKTEEKKVKFLGSYTDFNDYTACHLWDGQSSDKPTTQSSAYDPLYYTSLTNLVLLPSSLAGITDHHPEISECLRMRSHELYGDIKDSSGHSIKFPGARPNIKIYKKIVW